LEVGGGFTTNLQAQVGGSIDFNDELNKFDHQINQEVTSKNSVPKKTFVYKAT
jgi:hypothetical protein